jgi:hypothetical protein bacD2_14593
MKRTILKWLVPVLMLPMLLAGCSEKAPAPGEDTTVDDSEEPVYRNVSLRVESLEMTVGDTDVLVASFEGEGTEDLGWEWTSSDTQVAVVSADGTDGTVAANVTAMAKGKATVTISCTDSRYPELTASAEVTVTEQEIIEEGPLRILAIGNSFSQDAVEQYLYELFRDAGIEVVIGNMYIGGCSLEKHVSNAASDAAAYAYRKIVDGKKTENSNVALSTALADEKWDYISLQQVSGKSGIYGTYNPYLPQLIEYVKGRALKSDVQLMFHQTWAYASGSDHADFPNYGKDQMTMFNAIIGASRQAMSDNPDLRIRIPSGTAIQNGRTTWLGDTWCRDGYHLETTYGRYTAACTWFEAITGTDVTALSWKPETVGDYEGRLARSAAHSAILNPDSVTDMTDFKAPEVTSDGNTPVYVDFTGSKGEDAERQWASFAAYEKSDDYVYLNDASGNYTSVRMRVTSSFTSLHKGTGGERDTELEIDGISYPKWAWCDGLLISGTKGNGDAGPAVLELSGLEPGRKYRINIIACRENGTPSARQTRYVLNGAEVYAAQTINQGFKAKTAEEYAAIDFNDYGIEYADVSPDSQGRMTIEVTAIDTGSACDGAINALVITPVL